MQNKSLIVTAILITVYGHWTINMVHRYALRAELLEMDNKILNEQIADMETGLADFRALPTYEDGLRDGISNGANQSYMSGYHKGLQHGVDHLMVGQNSGDTK